MRRGVKRTGWVVSLLVAALLGIVQWKVRPPMLLAERFVPGAGWIEIAFLSVYAAWLYRRMVDPQRQPKARRLVWRLFSVVFYGQLVLGLLGVERCLMTGKLHLPIPILIAAGPLYRGGGYFMLGLFLMTVLLVGPAWCSHLCYLGSWDDYFATRRRRPANLARSVPWVRLGWAVAVLGGAWWLGRQGFSTAYALTAAAALGVGGVLLMVVVSRQLGLMFHCMLFCPIHVLATILGRLSPFRLVVGAGCTRCGICTLHCRYDALQPHHLERCKVGLSCTLCGDCLESCREGHLSYRFPGLGPNRSRELFMLLVVVLHAVFLGLARI